MPFNGSGTFLRVRNWVADAAAGIKIRADFHDAEDDGLAAGLSSCITRDGQSVITQNIPFNSKRITGLADPLNPQDAATQAWVAAQFAALSAAQAASDVGSLRDYAMASAPAGWLACDGTAVSRTTYAALFAAIGGTWGAGDGSTTFNVPNLMSRFRRHRDNNAALAGAVGALKGPANLAHSHRVVGGTGLMDRPIDHLHSGTTGSMNRSNPHSHTASSDGNHPSGGASQAQYYGGGSWIVGDTITVNATDINHEHAFTTGGADRDLNHAHGFDLTSQGGSADDANECRPYSAAVLTCIKF